MDEITWRLDRGEAMSLLMFFDEALANLHFDEGDPLEQNLERWCAELQELHDQVVRYEALLQPALVGLA